MTTSKNPTRGTATSLKRLRNAIVGYKGGGGDGNFWEWNFAYIDQQGEFHSIFASGYKGCKTVEELAKYIADCDAQPERSRNPHSSIGYDIYRLNEKSERDRFGRETPISDLLYAARWFNTEDIPFNVMVKCDCCGKKVEALSMAGEGCHGEGGIASQYNQIICEDCQSQYSCPHCGTWYGPDYKDFHPDTGYCESCQKRGVA